MKWKPTLVQVRANELERWLENNVTVTGKKHHRIVTYNLYHEYIDDVGDDKSYPRETFPMAVMSLLPGIKGVKYSGYYSELVGLARNKDLSSGWPVLRY